MKKLLFPLFLALIVLVSCQTKTNAPVDPAAAKAEITQWMDNFYKVFNERNVDSLMKFNAEDGLFLGTDPTEHFDYATYRKSIESMLADTSLVSNVTVDKRVIRVDPDGKAAQVIDQMRVNWAGNIQVRNTFFLVKKEKGWICDCFSTALIPFNKDIAKLVEAVK